LRELSDKMFVLKSEAASELPSPTASNHNDAGAIVMAEASIQQKALIQITTAAHVLAMLRARNAVKEELRKQGLKLTEYSAREITSWASVYLDDHRSELMPDAIAQARAMILAGVCGKRAARALRAKLESDAQRTEA
jgi:hypothetical protein